MCAWACIRVSPRSRAVRTSGSTSAAPRASARSGTEGRLSSHRRRASSSQPAASSGIWAPTRSPGCPSRSGSSSSSSQVYDRTSRRCGLRVRSATDCGGCCRDAAHASRHSKRTAWQTRRLLPSVATPLQAPLAELGGAIFTGYRAAAGADRMLARVDRRRLTRRLAAQREMAVYSRRARQEAESLEAQIARVDRLLERRQALADLAGELPSALDETLTAERIASLRERVATTTAQLDEATARAASVLDPLSFKHERTRHRGVYRSNGRYVVPFSDELGVDRRREFETLDEARNFRTALRVAEKQQTDYNGPSFQGPFEGGPGGGT